MSKTRRLSIAISITAVTALAPGALGVGNFTTSFDDTKVKMEMTGLTPGGTIAFMYLPPGFDHDALPWGVVGAGGELVYSTQVGATGSWSVKVNRTFFAVGAEYAVYSYDATGWGYYGISVPNPLADVQAPPMSPVGPDTIQVVARPGGGADVIFLNDLGDPADDVVMDGGGFPLIQALRGQNITGCTAPNAGNIPPNDPVIGIYGRIPQGGNGMQIGGGDAGCKSYVVHWADEPMRFTVIGRTPDAAIQNLGFIDNVAGTPTGGVEDGRFENLSIEAKYESCASSPKHGTFGMMRFYNCHFEPSPESLDSGSYSGLGYKFGIRSRGLGRYDIRDCSFEPVLEHCIYVDSPQGDSWISGVDHNGSTRTAVQVVNRPFDIDWISTQDPDFDMLLEQALLEFETGQRTAQVTGFGILLIENVTIRQLTGDGGSGITVAGHLGDIVIRNINAVDAGPFQGVIAVWADADKKKGLHLYSGWDGQQYAHRSVTIENVTVNLAQPDRDAIKVGATEFVRILGFSASMGNFRAPFSLDSFDDNPLTGDDSPKLDNDLVVLDGAVTRSSEHVDCRQIDFFTSRPLIDYSGFLTNPKIKYRDMGTLSDTQIGDLWPDL